MLQTLAFIGPRQINAAGRFFRYETVTSTGIDPTIRVRANGQDLGLYVPGDSIELPEAAKLWEVAPLVSTCAGTVRVGMGRVQSSKVAGVVSIIDAETDKVVSGRAFRATADSPGGGAYVAHAQIWNPAGSGRLCYVRGANIGASAADGYGMWLTQTQAATLTTAPHNIDPAGVASAMEVRIGNTAPPFVIQRRVAIGYAGASVDVPIEFKRPILLRPGWGLVAYLAGTAASLRVGFDIEEAAP